jgi:hypothetical protein
MCNINPTERCSLYNNTGGTSERIETSIQPLIKQTISIFKTTHFIEKNWIPAAIGVLLALTEKKMLHVI